ncbi:hypothetical protein L7F22_063156 [Adiantum nelumboides]|nr:hypothetical protein [Adiantum nelumboides]
MAANMKFLERKFLFSYRGKEITLDVNSASSTVSFVQTRPFDKVIKCSIPRYMVFVKESKENACVLKESCIKTKEESKLSNLLHEFQDVFTNDILSEFPPTRGQDDDTLELLPGSSPPNKPPYRVSLAQQEEIMRQVNKIVEKGMDTLRVLPGRSVLEREGESERERDREILHRRRKQRGKTNYIIQKRFRCSDLALAG